MGSKDAAILLTAVVHVIGTLLLIWLLIHGQEDRPDLRGWWRGDDGPHDPQPRDEPPAPTGGGLPLPGAGPSPVRLREPGRIAGGYERPARRPAHEPARRPERV